MRDFHGIDGVAERFIAAGYFPSAVVTVFDRSGTLYRKAYGENAMPDGSILRTNENTAFDMASCTKIATATQILLRIADGNLRLMDRVPELLPETADMTDLYPRVRSVTVYQLLTHTSGLLNWFPFYTLETHTDPGEGSRRFLCCFDSIIAGTPIVRDMVYSDMNFMLLGLILERIGGKPLSSCLEDLRSFLGAARMRYLADPTEWEIAPSCYDNAIEEDMVAERGLRFDGWRPHGKPVIGCNDCNAHYFFGGVAGHAGICADADAFERLGRLYLTTEIEPLVSSTRDLEYGRGLGWAADPDLYPRGCGHTGFTGPSIWVSRELGIGAVALTNRLAYPASHGTNTNEFRRALAAEIVRTFR